MRVPIAAPITSSTNSNSTTIFDSRFNVPLHSFRF